MSSRRSAFSGIPLGTLVGRGLRKRCPICGTGRVFRTFFKMNDACSSCGYPFEREEGYWTGAMIVNIAFAEIWFGVLFATVLIATIPDVAWMPLLVVALVTNGLLPVVFYPHSKTLWMALDLYFHPNKLADAPAGAPSGTT